MNTTTVSTENLSAGLRVEPSHWAVNSRSTGLASEPCALPATESGDHLRTGEQQSRFCAAPSNLESTFSITADSYGPFVSEELIAEALSPYPKDLVIATKGGWNRPGAEPVDP